MTCGNYRGLSMLAVARKSYTRILKKRMERRLEEVLGEEQAGFRPGRSTTDMVFVLRQLAEKFIEYNLTLYNTFIDYSKAFDTIWREFMWQVLNHFGFSKKLIEAIKTLYEANQSAVVVENEITEFFTTSIGVLQGCILSPPLFNLALEAVLNLSQKEIEDIGVKIYGKMYNNMRYADDIDAIAESEEDLQRVTTAIDESSRRSGMVINLDKTKTMVIGRGHKDINITINNQVLEQVKSFVYLGSNITENNEHIADVKRRLNIAREKFYKLETIWKDKYISDDLKVRLLHALITPIATYGCETWTLTEEIKQKIEAFEMTCYRYIANIHWSEHITNEHVLKLLNTSTCILSRIYTAHARYLGHVLRMPDSRLPRQALEMRVSGRRPRGRPRYRWFQRIQKELNLSSREITNLAGSRADWRRATHDVDATSTTPRRDAV